jgi:hypothetical protein
MFILSERFITLGAKYAGTKKEHFKFELENIPLEPEEVNQLFGSRFAHGRLHCYSLTERDEPDLPKLEPFLPGLKTLEIERPLEGAYIQLRYGLSNDRLVRFVSCTLSKIKVELGENGATTMSAKVQAPPVLDETLTELIGQFGQPVLCELRSYPPDAQPELPLNKFGTGERAH